MEFTISLTKTTVVLLFSTLMLIQMANSFYSCKEPSQIGDFLFLAKSWPKEITNMRKSPKFSSLVINCTTNFENASVWLETISSSNTWSNFGVNTGESLERIGQIFIISKVQKSGRFFSCKGKWMDKTICLYKGLSVIELVDVKIEIHPKENPFYAIVGESLNIFCEAPGVGSETDSYLKWYKKTSGGEIEVDKSLVRREAFSHNGIGYDKEVISIPSSKKSDAGIYICKRQVSPQSKVISKQIEVIIQDPTKPVVILNPPDRKIIARDGQSEQIKVVCQYASGSPKPKKEWKDPRGTVLHECDKHSDTCTLIINRPTYEKHHGRYTCVATSSGGTSTVDVMIDILLKVKLEKSIIKEVAGYEESATITCKVGEANPLPTMVWYFQPWICATAVCKPDDREWTRKFAKVSLTPASNVPTNESRLVVPASKTTAFYSCQAMNSLGTDVYNVTLHRLATPPTIFELSKPQKKINENGTLHLNCSASLHTYKGIRWVKDGASVKEEPGRIVIRTVYRDFLRVLVINFKRLAIADTGKYTCVAVMRNGTEKSLKYDIFVRALESPVISGFENRTLNETKQNFLLLCNASGNPLPSLTWKFNGRAVIADGIIRTVGDCSTRRQGKYFIERSGYTQLVICDMNYKLHQGLYECTAESKLGRIGRRMFMKIISPPRIVRWEEKVVYHLDSSIRLFCEAEGNPAPNITLARIMNGKQEEMKNLKRYGNGSVYVVLATNEKINGRYACLAENIAGKIVKYSQVSEQEFSTFTQTKPVSSTVIAVIVVCCIVFVIIVLFSIFWYKRRLEQKYAPYLKPNKFFELDPDRTLFEQSSELPYDPDWEFPRDRLNFVKMIGSGAFGEVWLAEAEGILTLEPRDKTSNAAKRRSKIRRSHRYTHLQVREKKKAAMPESTGEKTLVAVKTLKGDASDTEYKDLASELKILIHIGENKQIVNLLGACTRGGKLCVVLEYCPHGSLLNFLRDRREIYQPVWFKNEPDMSNELTNMDLTMISYQIAKGLDFLASKRCVHRDVAARNVLIGVDYIVKVADFGLARDIYKDEFYMKSTSGLLPVKWMAPESLFDKIYTSQSDVWSYGIVLWEIFTLGGSPYPGLPTEDLFSFLEQGRRMEQPEFCPLEFYAIMNDCWEKNPNDRPLFSQLVDRIAQITANRSGEDNPYLEMDRQDGLEQPENSDYLEPIIKRSQPHRDDGYLTCDQKDRGFGMDRDSIRKAEADHDIPSYLNDDTVRMSLLEGYDESAHDYANTRQFDGLNEFTV